MDGRERNFFRTQKDQARFPGETAEAKTFVQFAIVYSGRQITTYRNGQRYSSTPWPRSLSTLGRGASSSSESVIGDKATTRISPE